MALLLAGETFRGGGQFSRLVDTNGTARTQRLASETQVEHLVRPILIAGYEVFCSTLCWHQLHPSPALQNRFNYYLSANIIVTCKFKRLILSYIAKKIS